MKRDIPVHYLRRNDTVWTPPAVICLDTETSATVTEAGEVHELRCWVASYDDRRASGGRPRVSQWDQGADTAGLVHRLRLWCQGRRTVWLYAHNLHFDLSVTDLVGRFTRAGWVVSDFSVDGGSPFVRLVKGDCHLTVCDSFSWLPVPLAQVAGVVDIAKPPLPGQSDSLELWLERCRSDVEILRAAMLALMDWWDSAGLGRWAITGNAAGWNAMRHIPMSRHILINPDPGQVKADRAAVYGGRRGSWRHGQLAPGRYAELDLERAYTTVCAELPLPCERMAAFTSLPLDHPWLDCQRHGVIANCLIRTDTPRWPARADGRVWYPVGEFWTTLAGPDIAEARRLGALVAVGAGWVHKLGYALRNWAAWVAGVVTAPEGQVPGVARLVARHWGRSVVGKWAQRGFDRVQLGPSPGGDWTYTEAWHHGANVRGAILDFAGSRWQITASAESDNAYPAILAFVESYVRVRLGRIIAAIGEPAMVACDTDGLIIDTGAALDALAGELGKASRRAPAGNRVTALIGLAAQCAAPLRLREKRTWRKVTVHGPQHMRLDEVRRFAGVPGSAAETGDGTFTALLWPKLAWQLAHGRAGAFTRPVQSYAVRGSYAPGWVTDRGAVLPVELGAGLGGTNHIRPWPLCRHAAAGARLGPDQNKHLGRYADAENQAGRRAGTLPRAGGRAEGGAAGRATARAALPHVREQVHRRVSAV